MNTKTNIQFDNSPGMYLSGSDGLTSKRILSFDCGYKSLAYALVDVKLEVDISPVLELVEALKLPENGPKPSEEQIRAMLVRANDATTLLKIHRIGCVDVCKKSPVRSFSFKFLNSRLVKALDSIVHEFGPLLVPGTEILVEFQPNTINLDSYAVMCQVATYFAKDGYNVNFIDPGHKLNVDVGGPNHAACLARCSSRYAANKLFAKENLLPFLARYGASGLADGIPESLYNHIGDALLQILPAVQIMGGPKIVEIRAKTSKKFGLFRNSG